MSEFLNNMSTDEAPASTEEVLKRYIRANKKLRLKNTQLFELNGNLFSRIKYLRYIIKRTNRSREKMRARFFKLFDEKHGFSFQRSAPSTNEVTEK